MKRHRTSSVSISDLARHVALSKGSVSRILNGKGNAFSEQTRQRVLAAAEEMGYRPHGVARALATGRTHLVALWAQNCFTPFYALVGENVARQGALRHYQVMVNSRIHYVEEPGLTASFPTSIDGALFCDIQRSDRMASPLYRSNLPCVGMGVFHDTHMDLVEVDLYRGAVRALEHLLAPGCRRVAMVRNAEATRERDPRTRAYEDVLQAAGLPTEFINLSGQRRSEAREAIGPYVQAKGLPGALLCINDDVAIGCYRGLRDLGARLPEDVALVGCDGIGELEYLDTPISTIAVPVETMCRLAWDFLERRLQEPTAPIQQTTLEAELVVRASSRR